MLLMELSWYNSANDYVALIHVIIEYVLFKIVLKVFSNSFCKEVKVQVIATKKTFTNLPRALDAQHGFKCFICI